MEYVEAEGAEHFSEHPVGTGPFTFDSWAKDDVIVLRANEDYWKGSPAVEKVEFRVIPENQSRIAALQTGQVDIIVNVPPDQAEVLKEAEGTDVATVPSSRVIYIGINTLQEGPLTDPRVRRALNYAVDKQGIIDNILQGNGVRLASPITESHFGHNPDLTPFAHDPERAKELLAEAGWADGFELVFDAPSGRYLQDKEIAQAVAGQLQEVGLEVDLNVLEWGVYIEKVLAHKLEGIWLLGWGNSTFDADGTLFTQFHGESRHSYYNNPEFDALIEEARAVMDQEQRRTLYHDALEIVNEEAPWIFMHQQLDSYGVSDRVDWQPRADELIWLFETDLVSE
jgi:peptide/nickel transport system substrate-binding protein